jgi:hypothetical protein
MMRNVALYTCPEEDYNLLPSVMDLVVSTSSFSRGPDSKLGLETGYPD